MPETVGNFFVLFVFNTEFKILLHLFLMVETRQQQQTHPNSSSSFNERPMLWTHVVIADRILCSCLLYFVRLH